MWIYKGSVHMPCALSVCHVHVCSSEKGFPGLEGEISSGNSPSLLTPLL